VVKCLKAQRRLHCPDTVVKLRMPGSARQRGRERPGSLPLASRADEVIAVERGPGPGDRIRVAIAPRRRVRPGPLRSGPPERARTVPLTPRGQPDKWHQGKHVAERRASTARLWATCLGRSCPSRSEGRGSGACPRSVPAEAGATLCGRPPYGLRLMTATR
jgi:hypothetical protein